MTDHGRMLEKAKWFASHAEFSRDERHRYTLMRVLDPHNTRLVQFIGLNPSTADQYHDDPTVRRCISFAQEWGYGTFVMTNLFGLRSTDPKVLYTKEAQSVYTNALRRYYSATGFGNDRAVIETAKRADIVVCAWGVHGAHLHRAADLLRELRLHLPTKTLHCLGRTKEGHPKHPLYLSKKTQLEVYDA